ncbi:MAG: competence/damage-inducible protein A [Lachnospiraceae bacterium]|nr:competence/damage-inducible protein A [Clostridium sp.]MDY4821621.1 competence/damage-inducible protein A [Lachnospiraceae bacterium]
MTAEIICVGTELLLGNIVNTNAAFLSEKLAYLGINCYFQTVVGDNRDRLLSVINTALSRADILIFSGGLGPTEDDLTKETVAEALGKKLIRDKWAEQEIADYFALRGRIPTDNNWKQADVIEGCEILYNKNGTAPGIFVSEGEKTVILLPGPPLELKSMFTDSVMPKLQQKCGQVFYSQTVKIVGPGESSVETQILDMLNTQENPTIAPYAKTGEVHLRVTARAKDEKEAREKTAPVVEELYRRFGNAVYTTDADETLEMALTKLLIKKKYTMTTAESCTGGMIAARMVNAPGVSAVLKSGFITYANEAKEELLGVSHDTLEKFGAVSRETAEEMAEGAVKAAHTDAAVAVTGIAGPDGGTKEKPVGLVYIGVNVRGNVEVREYHFSGSRQKIRESVTAAALTFLREKLLASEERG